MQVDEAMVKYDTDNSGRLELKEFVKMFADTSADATFKRQLRTESGMICLNHGFERDNRVKPVVYSFIFTLMPKNSYCPRCQDQSAH